MTEHDDQTMLALDTTDDDTPSDVDTPKKSMLVDVEEDTDLFGAPVKMPPAIEREVFADALRAQWVGMSLQEVVSIITNPYDELIEYAALIRGRRACQKTSLLFNPHRLDCASSTDKRYGSIYKAMQSLDFHSGMARATIFRAGEMLKASGNASRAGEILYMTMQIGVNGTQYVNEFPPHLARDTARRYGLGREHKILDPCAGWGGRMLGFSIVAGSYTCYEPSTLTAQGLKKLSEFIASVNHSFDTDINCLPYEDSDEIENHYDFAMTSPPYYDTERYSDEETQSCVRYQTFDAWCEGFYLPLVDKTMRQLKPGRPFIINIGDRKYPLTKVLQDHCDSVGYTMRRVTGGIMNNAGFGREADGGEKFYEITTNSGERLF